MNHSYYQTLRRYEGTPLGSLFIIKIVKAKPPGVELHKWIDLIFGLHERIIVQFTAERNFQIKGLYKPTPHIRISGLHIPRQVHCRQRVWVRFDLRYENVIEIEAPIGHANESKIFQIDRPEWVRVSQFLIPTHVSDRKFLEDANKKTTKVFPVF